MEAPKTINNLVEQAPRRSFPSSSGDHLPTRIALEAAIHQRSLDPAVLDVRGISTIADYFVIVSGTSQRHIQGICDKVEAALKNVGERPTSISGYENGEWVVMDYGDLIVHILYEPARQFYRLDDLWGEAPRLPFGEELEHEARRLRTGTVR